MTTQEFNMPGVEIWCPRKERVYYVQVVEDYSRRKADDALPYVSRIVPRRDAVRCPGCDRYSEKEEHQMYLVAFRAPPTRQRKAIFMFPTYVRRGKLHLSTIAALLIRRQVYDAT